MVLQVKANGTVVEVQHPQGNKKEFSASRVPVVCSGDGAVG